MERVFESRALHVFTSSFDLFTGLLFVSFVTGPSDLLKLCFYYAQMKSAPKSSNTLENLDHLQTSRKFVKSL